ncbi:MAG: CvpA family protein [Haliscomenobacter sp.]|nr:CvpA family protein [Haliscomenobacter sp.]
MVIDIILVIVAVYGFYVGYTRGIIKTIFSVLAIAVGIIAALRFSPAVTDFLKQMFNETSPLMFVAGLILTFALTMMFLKLLGRGFEGLLEAANINVINQPWAGRSWPRC